jgi:hypothetical protein
MTRIKQVHKNELWGRKNQPLCPERAWRKSEVSPADEICPDALPEALKPHEGCILHFLCSLSSRRSVSALRHTFSTVKPYSFRIVSPGAEAPKPFTPTTSIPAPA